MKLGVCYYPEHWPDTLWADDAQRMRQLGIEIVRIGEFAWSRLEPEPERYDWDWLDQAFQILADAGLQIILGTPTATPPRWLVARHPDILPVDANGLVRGFGSRRHYCFSSSTYRLHCRRIVSLLAERYGQHPALRAWQIDNEYGCHDTALSYSPAAAVTFRDWLKQRYGDINALNQAWGTVFWSQEYRDFDEINPPVNTVTEAHPSKRLDYRRFASDQVVSFNREQVNIIRPLSPGRDILHNFMGFTTDFDHFKLGQDLDVASWDSYPLGFLEDRSFASEEEKYDYARTGHPDIAAFHHDLYRGVGHNRWWVMEQQPGPVNWAPYNPAPLPGMVRLWTWEAFAHGAEVVSYFRWRQAPFAQEQMHTGLYRPDNSPDQAVPEVRQVIQELARVIPDESIAKAPIALVFDYESKWLLDIQPQGESFDYLQLSFEWYSALRRLGIDVDIIPSGYDLNVYRAVLIPSLPIVTDDIVQQLQAFQGEVLIGPRSGSKTNHYQIPEKLPPGPLQDLIPLRIERVESLRPGLEEPVLLGNNRYSISHWREFVASKLDATAYFADGKGALYQHGNYRYLAGWPDTDLLQAILQELCREAAINTIELAPGLRLRRFGALQFAFNYGPTELDIPVSADVNWVLGQRRLRRCELAAWRATH